MRNILWMAVLAPSMLCAQEFRGTISGSVIDPQNASISTAKIEVTEIRTGAKSLSASDSAGKYVIPFLAPGIYRIAAEAPG